ncbi:response regulator transcription factor [Kribbella albertanoniae]|uniref:Response regulator transcription factor n=1 Tax=Kribbella albertanoniae TaxID=1266829 RepID=A0A4R4P5K9_9ACTN|nr:response regulator transcription factor [Kribbella albertanoniae]TDC17718.1 response regulator transcription factor [Kribbella albertanoniae]
MIKVLLLDDEGLVRNGIRLILQAGGTAEVVAEDTNGANVVELVEKYRPDVVLTDIQMPQVNGIEVTRRVTALPDPPPVVVLTTFDLDEYVYEALQAGATGFLLKDIAPRALVEAVEQAVRGDSMLSPRITKRLISSYTAHPGPAQVGEDPLKDLTPREREVAIEVAEGLSNAEIAAKLVLSESTVKVHITHIMAKLGLSNRTKLALLVHDLGLA